MKRCPQCEFIYEDEQSLCDMDGVLLVFDSRKLPNLHALTTVPAVRKAQRRNRAVPAFATLVLALVLGMVYYVSTRQPSYTPAAEPSALSIAPVAIPTPEPLPSIEPAPVKVEIKEPTAPVKKPATKVTTASAPQTKRTSEPKKDDSKVSSILKKTGRILKKPFKKF
jgi:hypothetical protein